MNPTQAVTVPVPTRVSAPPSTTALAQGPGPGHSPSSLDQVRQGAFGRMLWGFRREFAWVMVFSMFVNLLTLTPTLYMLQVFDRVMASGNTSTLFALTILMVFLTAVMAFAEWVRSRLLVRASGRFDDQLNRQVFAAAFAEQLAKPQRSPQQPLTDLGAVRQFLTGNGAFAIADTPWAVIFIAVLFLMHPYLGWLALFFCVVQVGLGFFAQHLSAQSRKRHRELVMDSSQYLQAKLRNAETVESMGMQANLRRQWMALHDRQTANQARVQETQRRMQALMKWVQYTQQALILSLGALLAIDGLITPGAMVASNALMGNALRPFGLIVGTWGQAVEARAAFRRLSALMARRPPESTESPAADVTGQLTLDNLVATAPGRSTPILNGVSAEFRAGELVAIIGPSGAGKSTLARCLLGIWPDTEGQVLLDGHPIHSWPRQALGPHVGYLPQDIELFDGSIAQNIARFGRVAPAVVIDAATRAGIHEMVLRLPNGYDTPIGDAGSILSGGQRQRLGLARALLGTPAVVVLDEPTANLDDVGEAALRRVLLDLKQRGTTVFMIVHQPHLLGIADRLLVLEGGQIRKLAPIVAQPAAPAQSQIAPQ